MEIVQKYIYLGVYVGYTNKGKEAELKYITTMCKSRLQSLKSLAWAGKGVGINALCMVYISTVRSLIDCVAPALSVIGKGRQENLERTPNEAMRIIIGCQRNAMVEVMRIGSAKCS